MTHGYGIPARHNWLYVDGMIDEDAIRYRWETVGRKLDERGRRMFAAAEASTAGWGGLAAVSRITGLARSTINRGQDDLDAMPLAAGWHGCILTFTGLRSRRCMRFSTGTGMVEHRKRRRNRATGTPLSNGYRPNDLWCATTKASSCSPIGAIAIR